MRFVGSYSLTQGARSGLRIVELQVSSASRGRRVLLNELPFRSPFDLNSLITGMDRDPMSGRPRLIFTPIQAQATSLIIADELEECRFSYLLLPRNRVEPGLWVTHWDDLSRLPGAIRLEMIPRRGEARLLPVSITAPVRARFPLAGGGGSAAASAAAGGAGGPQ